MGEADAHDSQANDAIVRRVFTVAVDLAEAGRRTDDPETAAMLARCRDTLDEIVLLVRRTELARKDPDTGVEDGRP